MTFTVDDVKKANPDASIELVRQLMHTVKWYIRPDKQVQKYIINSRGNKMLAVFNVYDIEDAIYAIKDFYGNQQPTKERSERKQKFLEMLENTEEYLNDN